MYDHAHNLNIVQLGPSTERLPLFIVGDVHGCAWELKELLKAARQRVPQFQLVLVGDLFTKGPDPVGVYETIRENNGICIKGNHDWALQTLLQSSRKNSHNLPDHSQQTLYLIRHHKKAIFQFLANLPHALITHIVPEQPPKGWENQYPLAVVHAGIDCTKGLLHSSERMLLTARYVRWDTQTPPGPDQRLLLVPVAYRQEALAARTDSLPEVFAGGDSQSLEKLRVTGERFRWHELHTGPELIVFGHDAKQGLFRKTNSFGRPVCVGIDTGCTYGRSLTGYFPETDDALQVASKRAHFDVHRNIILVKTPHVKAAV